jgi:phenylacetate 2-hydroxylase
MILRLILAFEMDESKEPGARKPNIDMLDFSDVRDSLVAAPKRFECCFKARDKTWLESRWQ